MSETTRILALILGPYLLFVGGVYAIRQNMVREMLSEFAQQRALVWFSGAVMLLAGLVLSRVHDDWSNPVAMLISLLSAIIIGQAALAVAVPGLIMRSASALANTRALVVTLGALAMVLGAYLLYAAISASGS